MLEAAFIEARHSRPVNPASSGTTLIHHDHDRLTASGGQPAARSRWYQEPGLPPMSAGSAGPTGRNPALASTFWEAALSWLVAALSVRRPYCAAASEHSSRTA